MTPRDLVRAYDAKWGKPSLPRPPYRDSDPAAKRFHKARRALTELLDQIGGALPGVLVADDRLGKSKLDGTPASLVPLDEHLARIDYPNHRSRDLLEAQIVPALAGYVAVIVLRTLPNLDWRFGPKVDAHALIPGSGGRRFYPFALARDAVFSGYRTRDFYEVVAHFVAPPIEPVMSHRIRRR
jgi:hypothetical protein